MASRKKTARKTTRSSKTARPQRRATSARKSAGARDAIALLKKDHAEAKKLFDRYEKAREGDKADIAARVCEMLTVHTQVEEELLYPAAREVLSAKDEALIDEAAVEHQSAKELIAQIEASEPGDELFDAQVKVLGEYVKHHVREEEKELFPKLRGKLDLKSMGEAIASRREELTSGGTRPRRGSGRRTARESERPMMRP